MKNEHPYGARRECRRRAHEAPAAQPQTARHGGSAKVRSAHPAAPVGNSKGVPSATLAAQPQTARHGGSAKVRSAHPAAHGANVEGMPPRTPAAQPQTARHGGSAKVRSSAPTAHVTNIKGEPSATPAARRERRRKPKGARRRRDEASCVVPPLALGYFPLARCRLTRRNSRSAVCALRSTRAA